MGNTTLVIVLISMFLSFSRIMAIQMYHYAPRAVAYHFESFELPVILEGMGYQPIQHNGTNDWDEWDLSPIKTLNGGKGMRMCYGKDWHRFPGSFLIADGVEVAFIKSDFDGALPAKFRPSESDSTGWWRRIGTRWETFTLNDQNEESFEHYVSSLSLPPTLAHPSSEVDPLSLLALARYRSTPPRATTSSTRTTPRAASSPTGLRSSPSSCSTRPTGNDFSARPTSTGPTPDGFRGRSGSLASGGRASSTGESTVCSATRRSSTNAVRSKKQAKRDNAKLILCSKKSDL